MHEHDTLMGRWSSKSGKHWVALYKTPDGAFIYDAPRQGGCLGVIPDAQALHEMERRVAEGWFQPDANVTPMRRVF